MNEHLRIRTESDRIIVNNFLSHIRRLPEVITAERFSGKNKAIFDPNAFVRLRTDRPLPNNKALQLYLHVAVTQNGARQALEKILSACNVDGTAILPTLAGKRWAILDASGELETQVRIFRRIAEMAAQMRGLNLIITQGKRPK